MASWFGPNWTRRHLGSHSMATRQTFSSGPGSGSPRPMGPAASGGDCTAAAGRKQPARAAAPLRQIDQEMAPAVPPGRISARGDGRGRYASKTSRCMQDKGSRVKHIPTALRWASILETASFIALLGGMATGSDTGVSSIGAVLERLRRDRARKRPLAAANPAASTLSHLARRSNR